MTFFVVLEFDGITITAAFPAAALTLKNELGEVTSTNYTTIFNFLKCRVFELQPAPSHFLLIKMSGV